MISIITFALIKECATFGALSTGMLSYRLSPLVYRPLIYLIAQAL